MDPESYTNKSVFEPMFENWEVDAAEPEQQGDPFQCFSALTASTQLTALILVEPCQVPVPTAAFDHMFPAGLVLQGLKVLCLEGSSRFVGPAHSRR